LLNLSPNIINITYTNSYVYGKWVVWTKSEIVKIKSGMLTVFLVGSCPTILVLGGWFPHGWVPDLKKNCSTKLTWSEYDI